MKSTYSNLMQSKYFNPAFNSAIFDGPVRIYFAQFHEALALKIYFLIQQRLPLEMARAKEASKASGANILLMIYPTPDTFEMSFDCPETGSYQLLVEPWNEDIVLGLHGAVEDESLDNVVETLRQTLATWKPTPLNHNSVMEL